MAPKPILFSLTEIACPNCEAPIGLTIVAHLTGVVDDLKVKCPKCNHKLEVNAYFYVEDEEEGK